MAFSFRFVRSSRSVTYSSVRCVDEVECVIVLN